MGIILITTLVAVFAYPLSPDGTPDANNMIVELSARPAGFSKDFLKVPLSKAPERKSFLSALFSGQPAQYALVPINGFFMRGDSVFARHYIDDGLEDTLRFRTSGIRHPTSTITFPLGTDRYGRDILSRLLVGARISLAVGIVAVLLSLLIGISLGAIAGYYGGLTDKAVTFLINILWAIPTLLLVFAIKLTIGKGFWQMFIAIGLTMWVSAARLIRGQVLQLREMDYITAARALGLSNRRIIVKHILPNIAGPVMVIAASNFATAILIEAGLSFLGYGVNPPTPSWGLMIKEHYNFLLANQPMAALIPGFAIMLLVYAFNILGNALRDALDVRA